MIWEGLVTEGLAITRAVHDRYHPSRRNPWNEVECGDHYARSMASYGVFLAACGFEYHGPKGHLGFAPRVTADRSVAGHEFKAAFTTANGWGSYSQNSTPETLHCSIALKWGTLRLRSLAFELPENLQATKIQVIAHSRPASFEHSQDGNRIRIIFKSDVNLRSNQAIEVRIGG
jgi:non-lysosomal glucosylceramidase